ncbi:MAG TPA: polynucleotide adenylyltransferase PcnB, partial [Vicinamibacterales bacterium]|nr:polynucleotide adenylyltransferase PcnB [Vicinamibacterales bacterium]
MVAPTIIPRPEHSISRRDIDPDALKVLYRLKEAGFVAYLVGGGVRDLLLGRQPKDFDVGTSAHPYQVKRLFRNCWIIGRRFRLAHVKFGTKVIEVATFRRHVPPADGTVDPGAADAAAGGRDTFGGRDLLIHRDNTFGTPEEDAFRRDFTINALFYDIATFSIIDYVGGLRDLREGIVRAIGDPEERFLEDPVRMLRAVAFAERLEFRLDPPVEAAIRLLRREIARAAPPRLMEEYYKILRTGASARVLRALASVGLLEPVAPVLQEAADSPSLLASLERLDAHRRLFAATPDAFTNPVLLGSLLAPLGFSVETGHPAGEPGASWLGMLPVARRDLERLYQLLALQRRLRDPNLSPRAARAPRAGCLRRRARLARDPRERP